MNLQLIQGHFKANDAVDIITQMVQVKIKFQEEKIQHSINEEDIKMREAKIKTLQKNLFETRKYIEKAGSYITIKSEIQLSE